MRCVTAGSSDLAFRLRSGRRLSVPGFRPQTLSLDETLCGKNAFPRPGASCRHGQGHSRVHPGLGLPRGPCRHDPHPAPVGPSVLQLRRKRDDRDLGVRSGVGPADLQDCPVRDRRLRGGGGLSLHSRLRFGGVQGGDDLPRDPHVPRFLLAHRQRHRGVQPDLPAGVPARGPHPDRRPHGRRGGDPEPGHPAADAQERVRRPSELHDPEQSHRQLQRPREEAGTDPAHRRGDRLRYPVAAGRGDASPGGREDPGPAAATPAVRPGDFPGRLRGDLTS